MDKITYYPLTAERWSDFEQLFGERGAYGGCWCMWWRSTRREFEARGGSGNRDAMKAIVDARGIPGILVYHEDRVFGWCSISPREDYGALERSPILKRIDDQPVWSMVCFYIDKGFRQQGLMGVLIDCAVAYAGDRGAKIVEAYPTIPHGKRLAPVSSYMGLPALFLAHGFELIAEPSKSRQIFRKYLGK